MDVTIEKRDYSTRDNYEKNEIDLAYEFTKKIQGELQEMLKAVVLFGSVARQKEESNDIDILLLVDDVSIRFSKEIVQTYRIIVKRTVAEVSERIHVTSMKLSSFWEYVKEGDPIATNILRDGYALIDTGMFAPLQHMLHQGRIGGSKEAVWTYLRRSEESLVSSSNHFLESLHDLYWSAIDASQAALMFIGEDAPSPKHVPEKLQQHFVKQGKLKKKHVKLVRKLYTVSKEIAHGKKTKASPKEVQRFLDDVKAYVSTIQDIVYS